MRGATRPSIRYPSRSIISTHTPHAGRDADVASTLNRRIFISTHTPHAGRDKKGLLQTGETIISTHTPHAGRDKSSEYDEFVVMISTHTPHAGRDTPALPRLTALVISTHTPHAGRDDRTETGNKVAANFNSHAPCGARRGWRQRQRGKQKFQLTRPMRGATRPSVSPSRCSTFQLTRPMRGATERGDREIGVFPISTHTPHAGRDSSMAVAGTMNIDFNSHAPCGARLGVGADVYWDKDISTHTPHAGRDCRRPSPLAQAPNFNSHAPCGARLQRARRPLESLTFQLTRPMRGATASSRKTCLTPSFQLTRPMRGATNSAVTASISFEFQLTRPMRGATR